MKANWFKLWLFIVLSAGSAEAQTTNSWDVGSGKWEAPGNWNNGAPSGNNAVNFIWNATIPQGGGVTTVDATTAANSSVMVISNLTVAAAGRFGTSPHTLFLNNAGTITPLQILNSCTIGTGGTLSITNSVLKLDGSTTNDFGGGVLGIDGTLNLYDGGIILAETITNRHQFAEAIGVNGSGTLNMTGGTNIVGLSALVLGYGAGSFGTVSITGGRLTANVDTNNTISGISISSGSLYQSNGYVEALSEFVGNGTLTVAAGTHMAGEFFVGEGFNTTGTVWVTGGQLLATNGVFARTYLGEIAPGVMTISNGTFETTEVLMGYNPGGNGTLTVAGGNCIVTFTLFIDNFINTTSTVWVTGGQLIATNIVISTGSFGPGPGTLNQSNGLVQTFGEYVGAYSNAVGTLTVSGGSHMLGGGGLRIASDLLATGVVWMTGGQLSVSGSTSVGTNGVGDLIVSNGTVLASQTSVGFTWGSKGMLLAAGGTTTASGLVVGDCASNAIGTVFVKGGSLFVTNATHTAVLDVRNGWVVLTAGRLTVDKLVMTNDCGFIFHGGGSLTVGSMLLDPNLDADGDGLPNGWEQAYGLDPLSSTGSNGGDGDPDGDGFTNWEEYQGGSNPTDPNSTPFRITSITTQGNDVLLTWLTAGGKTNVVQAVNGGVNGDYTTNGFSNVSPTIFVGGSGLATTNYTDTGGATNKPARYYRVRLVP